MGKKLRGLKRNRSSAGRTPLKGKTHKRATEEETGTTDLDSAQNTTPRLLELVEWRDANFQMDDEGFEGDFIVATVGWTEEKDEWLKITSEVTPSGERAVTRVPLVNIVARKALVIVKSPSTWTTSHEHTE